MHFGAHSLENAHSVSISLSSASAGSFDASAHGEVTRPEIEATSSVETLTLEIGAFRRSSDNAWISACFSCEMDAS